MGKKKKSRVTDDPLGQESFFNRNVFWEMKIEKLERSWSADTHDFLHLQYIRNREHDENDKAAFFSC